MTTLAIDPGRRSGRCLIWNDKPTSGIVDGTTCLSEVEKCAAHDLAGEDVVPFCPGCWQEWLDS